MKKSLIIAIGVGLGLAVSAVAGNHKSYNHNSRNNTKYTRQSSYKSKNHYQHPVRKIVVYQPVVQYRKPEVIVVNTGRSSCYPEIVTVKSPSCSDNRYRRYGYSRNNQTVEIINSSLLLLGAILNSANH